MRFRQPRAKRTEENHDKSHRQSGHGLELRIFVFSNYEFQPILMMRLIYICTARRAALAEEQSVEQVKAQSWKSAVWRCFGLGTPMTRSFERLRDFPFPALRGHSGQARASSLRTAGEAKRRIGDRSRKSLQIIA